MSFVALWAGVGVLGGVGALARFLVHGRMRGARDGRFPLRTLAVNLSGSLALGILLGAALSGDAYLLAATALIGSYTTFSTWMLESHRLAEDGLPWLLAANLALSLVCGIAAVALGRLIAGG